MSQGAAPPAPPGLSPTEARLFALLADGRFHGHAELRSCLWDDLAGGGAVWAHVRRLRIKLDGTGLDVAGERRGQKGAAWVYRLVARLDCGPTGHPCPVANVTST